MAEEKQKKEEFREFQRKIKESIRDQMAQNKQELLDESSTQLNIGGGDDKDGAGAPLAQEEEKKDVQDAASDKPTKGGNKVKK